MTILYLHQYFTFPDTAGGIRSYDLSLRFTKAGHKVIIITTSANLKTGSARKRGWTIQHRDGLELHILDLAYDNKFNYWKRIQVFIKFLIAASVHILKLEADIIIATSTPLTIGVPAVIKKWINKTPYIFEIRDLWPDAPIALGLIRNKLIIKFLKWVANFIYLRASNIVTLSRDIEAAILLSSKVKKQRISNIPNISDISRFEQFDDRQRFLANCLEFIPQKIILYAGTIGVVNGLKYMIDLASYTRFLDPTIIYAVFGDGKEKEGLINYASELGLLNKTVFFFEPVPKNMLPQIYHECTVATSFVIPIKELWSNSANKFFDALASGRPIVINHGGWMAEEIEKNNMGYLLNPDVNLISETAKDFCEYLNDSDLLKEQGRNAKCNAMENFSLNIASAKYLKILEDVL